MTHSVKSPSSALIVDLLLKGTLTAEGLQDCLRDKVDLSEDTFFVEFTQKVNQDHTGNSTSTYGGEMTPFMIAALLNNVDALTLLLPHSKMEFKNHLLGTALHLAARQGHLEAVSFLLSAGANPEAHSCQNGVTGGTTPLMQAVFYGHEDCFLKLASVSNLAHTNEQGNNALWIAVGSGSLPIVKHLSQHLSLHGKNAYGAHLLHAAAHSGSFELLQWLSERLPRDLFLEADGSGNTVLINAARNPSISRECMSFILQYSDLLACTYEEQTALHFAAQLNHPCIDLLIPGSNLEHHDDEDYHTPLSVAASWGHFEAVDVLLKAGAKLHCHQKNLTPLHLAATRSTKLMEMLIPLSNPMAQDNYGNTPLMRLAKISPDGRRLNSTDYHGGIEAHTACLINAMTHVTTQNKQGFTAADLARNAENPQLAAFIEGYHKARLEMREMTHLLRHQHQVSDPAAEPVRKLSL